MDFLGLSFFIFTFLLIFDVPRFACSSPTFLFQRFVLISLLVCLRCTLAFIIAPFLTPIVLLQTYVLIYVGQIRVFISTFFPFFDNLMQRVIVTSLGLRLLRPLQLWRENNCVLLPSSLNHWLFLVNFPIPSLVLLLPFLLLPFLFLLRLLLLLLFLLLVAHPLFPRFFLLPRRLSWSFSFVIITLSLFLDKLLDLLVYCYVALHWYGCGVPIR